MKQGPSITLTVFAACLLGGARGDAQPAADKLVIQGMKIGMAVEGNAGFVCTKQPAGANDELEETHCVKFTDPRCTGKPAAIGKLAYGDSAPLGCFFDYSSFATYLDDTLQQTPNTGDTSDPRQKNPKKPLTNIHLAGTRSKPSKIYRIDYTTAPDDLAEGSKLYEAMVAKYGAPTSKSPPTRMRWKADSSELDAQCNPPRACELMLRDSKFREVEERRYMEATTRARRANAPAPQL